MIPTGLFLKIHLNGGSTLICRAVMSCTSPDVMTDYFQPGCLDQTCLQETLC